MLFALSLGQLCVVSTATAGGVTIVVSDDAARSCYGPAGGEELIYRLTTGETNRALSNYFSARPNPKLYNAALANAGLKFCSDEDRRKVFHFMLKVLNGKNPPKEVSEVILNYYRSATLLNAVEQLLQETKEPAHFIVHLKKIKELILVHRVKNPRYPMLK